MSDLPKWATQVALGALALFALIMALNMLGWRFDPFNRAEADKEGRAVAEDQSGLNAGATQTVEHVLRTETFVRTQAEEASHAIAIAPGADAPVPDDVLSAWRAGIVGVRQAPAAGSDPGS